MHLVKLERQEEEVVVEVEVDLGILTELLDKSPELAVEEAEDLL